MQALQDKARADGIDVPITHKRLLRRRQLGVHLGLRARARCRFPAWTTIRSRSTAPTPRRPGGRGARASPSGSAPDAPGYAAEYQAGAIDLGDAGYDAVPRADRPGVHEVLPQEQPDQQRVHAARRTTWRYGGTNWGWLAPAQRRATPRTTTAPRSPRRASSPRSTTSSSGRGYFLQAVAPLTKTDPATAAGVGQPRADDRRPGQPGHRHPVRPGTAHRPRGHDRRRGHPRLVHTGRSLPGAGAARRPGREGPGGRVRPRRAAAGLVHLRDHDARRDRRPGRGRCSTAPRAWPAPPCCATAPARRCGCSTARSRPSYDPATGDLRLDYRHAGLARVLVSGGGRRPLLLLLGTDATAAAFWRVDTAAGPVLVRGTSLVRVGHRGRRHAAPARRHRPRPARSRCSRRPGRLSVNGGRWPTRRTGERIARRARCPARGRYRCRR